MIKLKGLKRGLMRCVIPEDISEKKMLEEFERLAAEGGNILAGSGVEIDMGARSFTPALILKVWKYFIEPAGCHVTSWRSSDEATRQALRSFGVLTSDNEETESAEPVAESGLLFAGNIRGGQSIKHDGDVIIAGHVHDGSEVVVSGHIVVLGRLRGVVHAGAYGDEAMSVSVRSLETGQVRIGNHVGIIEKKSEFWGKPAIITVKNSEILIAGWPAV